MWLRTEWTPAIIIAPVIFFNNQFVFTDESLGAVQSKDDRRLHLDPVARLERQKKPVAVRERQCVRHSEAVEYAQTWI